MNVISRRTLDEFMRKHADSREPLLSWYREACGSVWKTPQDIKNKYPSASFTAGNTVIFNIKGNKYRLVTKVAYKTKIVFVKWFGPHAEYDKLEF